MRLIRWCKIGQTPGITIGTQRAEMRQHSGDPIPGHQLTWQFVCGRLRAGWIEGFSYFGSYFGS